MPVGEPISGVDGENVQDLPRLITHAHRTPGYNDSAGDADRGQAGHINIRCSVNTDGPCSALGRLNIACDGKRCVLHLNRRCAGSRCRLMRYDDGPDREKRYGSAEVSETC